MKMNSARRTVLGASIGNCVHVAGVYHFLQIAENEGCVSIFLGPAVTLDHLFQEINSKRPDIVDIGYRLTPENVIPLLDEIQLRITKMDYKPLWVFGGTKPVAEIAKKYHIFSFISDGFDDIDDSIRFLRGDTSSITSNDYGSDLVERTNKSYPYPILRHHFGLPTVDDTVTGIQQISNAKVLDVISLGPDQNAQQFFFNQQLMKKEYDGAGGVPIRTKEDLIRLKESSLCGNFPLMRCYSGTEDVLQYAKLLRDTIHNAWTAIPIFWYNELDGRGTRTIEVSIREAQQLIKWHAEQNIPVECNDPHHWGLRDAHDVIPVVSAYISAYNAKKFGVKNYISQYMFNNPHGLSFSMDFARVLAMCEIVDSLQDETFTVYRQSRAGLPLFHADPDIAKGQLAASTFMQMNIVPHIIHVVGYCEADHAARPEEVIQSCKIVRGVIRHTLGEQFSIKNDDRIQARKEQLLSEANVLINFILDKYSYDPDPLINPIILSDIVKKGYLDAVHIIKNEKFKGTTSTTIIDGSCVAIDKRNHKVLSELARLAMLEGENG